jgi:serine/threonine-protein kinase
VHGFGAGAVLTDQLDSLRTALASRYEVHREIGRGGMARVYLAHDRQHGRDVALKVLSPSLAVTIGPERFLREISVAARLQHPHILPLYESGSVNGLLYYVMPYVEGPTLRQRLQRESQLPLDDAIRIAREVADALDHAHDHGIVHRDIKPGNILLPGFGEGSTPRARWHAVVADFGLARALRADNEEPLTESGIVVGTPEYMSPEQAGGGAVDGRADVYALGCVLYEMLAGEPPFSSRTVQGVLAKHHYDPVPPLHVVRPSVPSAVEAAVERALAKVAADRFTTAAEFAQALEQGRDSFPTPRALPVRPSPSRRRRGTAAALGLALIIATALLVASLLRSRAPAALPEPAWIVVADFEGPAGDRTLPAAVRELVTAELDQSRVVAPLPRQQITAAMRDAGVPDTAQLTNTLARELAVRSSVRTILGGSVLPVAAGHYALVVRVVDADSGRTLLSVTRAASDSDLIPVVQDAAREIRRGLGERRAAIGANKPLVQVATPSFPAYRKYVEAVALSERGDVVASNGLLQEALALDTGFAAAWVTVAANYQTLRDLDSAGLALAEALRRPGRLSDAQRYRLEADAAYIMRYDLPGAVRWYDLLLQIAPRSISGHNNRAVFLYSLGRYDEALSGFRRAEELNPLGLEAAQIEVFNQTVTLLALGRDAEAGATARRLGPGPFADYAAQLLATYRGRWGEAESLSARLAAAPSTPPWVRVPAITVLAGAWAARGAVAAADSRLRTAAENATDASRTWFCNAALLLAAGIGRSPGAVPAWLLADTTSGGLLAGGLWAAMAGDSRTAAARLDAMEALPTAQLRRLGHGPTLLRAYDLAARGRWDEVTGLLAAAAVAGELDAGDLDEVSGTALRWLVGDAYARRGMPDSAAAMYELLLDPRRTPFSHLTLRGLIHSFASRRLAMLYEAMGRSEAAAPHWAAFRSAFVTPDPELRAMAAGP